MHARVLRTFLNGRTIVDEGDDIEVDEHRARELQANRLIVPCRASTLLSRFTEAPSWWPDWRGETCIILASGPSAADVPIDTARGRVRVLAVNNSWRLAPWADALYATDFSWWERADGVPDFAGLKLCQDDRTDDRPGWGIRHVTVHKGRDEILVNEFAELGFGGNSGFVAVNIALQAGADRIVLAGFDMRVDQGLHWHGAHGRGMNNPSAASVARWRRVLDDAAPMLAALGVEVINVSPASALGAYRKMSLEQALDA